MLEKHGMLTLTQDEIEEYKSGAVSKRLQEEWELDYSSLDGIIKAGSYEVVKNDIGEN